MRLTGWLTVCTSRGSARLWRRCSAQELNQKPPASSGGQKHLMSQQPGESQWETQLKICATGKNKIRVFMFSLFSGMQRLKPSFSSQSVSPSDSSAEVAVFSHSHSEPREAAAAGPPSAPALQLQSQPLQQRSSKPLPETRLLRLPPGSLGKRWLTGWSAGKQIRGSGEVTLCTFVS